MEKGVANKWLVRAIQGPGGASPGEPVTGDAANITAEIYVDGVGPTSLADTNPAELVNGFYVFDISDIENFGEQLFLYAVSSTADVIVESHPVSVYTTQTAPIKLKTDQLIFTKFQELNVNQRSINGITITGNGSTIPFTVAS